MEPTDSTQGNPDQTRSFLGIDLNEVPSSSSSDALSPDAFSVVRTFHDEVDLPSGAPAELPEESVGSACTACGRPEVEGGVVVCDGCERGFHLACAGMLAEDEAGQLDEWRCGECVSRGVQSSRWRLGSKTGAKRKRCGVRLLDMNALPPTPSDGEGEGSEDSPDSRKHTSGDNSFGSNLFGIPMTHSNSYTGNGLCLHRASDVPTPFVESGIKDKLHYSLTLDGSLKGAELNSVSEGQRNAKSMMDLTERHLCALRQYAVERHGALEDGWHVEFRQFPNSADQQVVYCAPDGRTFASIAEVACHLGLISRCNLKESQINSQGYALPNCKLRFPKRIKSLGLSGPRNGAECKENMSISFSSEQLTDINNMNRAMNSGKSDDMAGKQERNIGFETHQTIDGFPVQYEDFFILSLGKIDGRQGYHNENQIWPVGFRSCWHDKITGSIFLCDVSDGGEFGPLFKVQRFSCSELPIPNGSTVLLRKNLGQCCHWNEESSSDIISTDANNDEDFSVLTMLADPSPPAEDDILSCVRSSCYETLNAQTSNGLQVKDNRFHERYQNILADNSVSRDAIGEFSVEESSSSSAWKRMSEKIIDRCREIYMQKGTVKLFCKHVAGGMCSPCWNSLYEDCNEKFASLAKFCGLVAYVDISSAGKGYTGFESLLEELSRWLNQDRFGLDFEFVQEILEQLPGVEGCSNYVFLNARTSSSFCLTIKNGFLEARTNAGSRVKAVDGLINGNKGLQHEIVQDPITQRHFLPPGRPVSLKLSPWLVGDVIQVWEMFCRFQEVLDFNGSLSFEELENELTNPWVDNIMIQKNFEEDFEEFQGESRKNDYASDRIFSPSAESYGPTVPAKNLITSMQLEKGIMKESSFARTASATCGSFTGVIMTKVHNSLLNVLIRELQSKVALVLDPNAGSGEPKSKRGRKKDVDAWTLGKKTLRNKLPFNELTWPDLARRYILAILAMDGDLESIDVIIREGGKVLRCLQGDGGVLCGSLTGVAGIEADALLLAEATEKIFGSLGKENDTLTIDDMGSDERSPCDRAAVNDGVLPEWAQALEPVKKLPTNVGARIRKCVNDALAKCPPEWAKKILEHSISKEVYKGNASGPTKRAVLSALSRVSVDGSQQKPCVEKKKKKLICISDLIMKQCRNVLRQAASADDEKVFCNLLGRKLIRCGDNDDEGILGSPAMISRSLDFRTIDLRLAAGAYGGSHEAFLEDVRELWSNVRVAFEDEPDMVHLAETLSSNFEALYEKEVLTLFKKLDEYRRSDCLTGETKKEIDHLLASANEIQKAPWEEGVCKVCGIDRDDDSVLLCDTCDAEYHTYCLIPPLARIPEGNWYCPSCIAGTSIVQDSLEGVPNVLKHQKKNQREGKRDFLDRLSHLATVLEEKEYWELNVNERTYLLKFLCDELLNSALIRQHLEHCAEVATDLQQKLRSLSAEWKSLRCKGVIAAKAVKVDRRSVKLVGDGGKEDGSGADGTYIDKCNWLVHTLGDRKVNSLTDGVPIGDGKRWGGRNNQIVASHEGNNSSRQKELHSQQGTNHCAGENIFLGCVVSDTGKDFSAVSSCEDLLQQGFCTSLDSKGSNIDEFVPLMDASRVASDCTKVNSLSNESMILQNSIRCIEMQLLKLSIRREFLGSDSLGRLYWILAKSGSHPSVIVNENVELQYEDRKSCPSFLEDNCPSWKKPLSFEMDVLHSLGSSKASLHFAPNDSTFTRPSWVSYQSELEIKELLYYLKDVDPRERELKESILHFQRLCQYSQESEDQDREDQDREDHQMLPSISTESEDFSPPSGLSSRASNFLESKYGPFALLELTDSLKKRGKRAKLANDKMYRCECLEPLWPSRLHCFSCHKSFNSDLEFEEHDDAKCTYGFLPSDNSRESNDVLKRKGVVKTAPAEDRDEKSTADISKNGYSEFSTKLIRYQNDGMICPFDFENICAKFVVENSIKELVKEIGLVGTNGIPSFISSSLPSVSHPAVLMAPSQEQGIALTGRCVGDEHCTVVGKEISEGCCCKITDTSPTSLSGNQYGYTSKGVRPTFQWLEQRAKRSSLLAAGSCCVVPVSSLRPLVGKASHILRQLKSSLLDMEAVLPKEALRSSKAQIERRWAWRIFLKSAQTIYEMIQVVIVLEDMIKTEYLKNVRWYWSSLSAAAKTSTLSSLALHIYSLDLAIDYERIPSVCSSFSIMWDKRQATSDSTEKYRVTRKTNKKRKEAED